MKALLSEPVQLDARYQTAGQNQTTYFKGERHFKKLQTATHT